MNRDRDHWLAWAMGFGCGVLLMTFVAILAMTRGL